MTTAEETTGNNAKGPNNAPNTPPNASPVALANNISVGFVLGLVPSSYAAYMDPIPPKRVAFGMQLI